MFVEVPDMLSCSKLVDLYPFVISPVYNQEIDSYNVQSNSNYKPLTM